MNILTINARLSSVKLKVFKYYNKNKINLLVSANIRLEKPMTLTISNGSSDLSEEIKLNGDNSHIQAIEKLFQNPMFSRYTIDCTISKIAFSGDEYTNIILLHINTLNNLSKYNDLLPSIQPYNILVAKYFLSNFSKIKHYACFDNGFHNTIPEINKSVIGKPHGIHGLSSEYLANKLPHLVDSELVKSNWIIVHLGTTGSICGIRKGRSFVTEMIPEAHGVLLSIADGVEISNTVYQDSAFILESYALSVARGVSMVATCLGGVEGIIFTGNISEKSPLIRKLILDNLTWIGCVIDKKANNNNKSKISAKDSKIIVLLAPTNEGVTMVNQLIEHKL